MATELKVSGNTVVGWLTGRKRIPGPAKTALSLLLDLGSQIEPAMTPAELKDAISRIYGDRVGVRASLAVDLNTSSVIISKWLNGRAKIPGSAKAAISFMLKFGTPSENGMTPEELREAISKLFDDRLISERQQRLARTLGVRLQTVTGWLSGRSPITGLTEVAISLLLKKRSLESHEEGRD